MFTVLLGMIVSGRQPDFIGGAAQFLISFFGGGALGVLAGRALLQLIPWTRDDRLGRSDADRRAPLSRFHRRRACPPRVRRGRGAVRRIDGQRLRTVAHHAL